MKGIELTKQVHWLPLRIVNVYLIQEQNHWYLIDTGTHRHADIIQNAVENITQEKKPSAIILTHGHFDHAGSALTLAKTWNIPIYAHPAEIPFLSNEKVYPQPDPSVGGFFAILSRFMNYDPINLKGVIQPLPVSGSVPYSKEWRWIHTPGHSPGHIALYRTSDGTLIAGDSLTTQDIDCIWKMTFGKAQVYRPGAPFTPNWKAAEWSVKKLAGLRPTTIACGHGKPITGEHVAKELQELADHFPIPTRGKYLDQPYPMSFE